MDNMYLQIGAAIVLLLTSIAGWFKAHSEIGAVVKDREATKEARTKDSLELHDKVLKLEFGYTTLKDAQALINEQLADTAKAVGILNTQLAQVLVKLDSVIDELKEMKQRHG
jgi:hypothetical protein